VRDAAQHNFSLHPVRRSHHPIVWAAVVLAVTLTATPLAACVDAGGPHVHAHSGTAGLDGLRVDVPETLSAATAAAQAEVDQFSAGNFADVWKHMSRKVRDGISQNDFVSFYRTCKRPGSKIQVFGLSLEVGSDKAVVQMRIRGPDQTRIMVYENGDWAMEPTGDFASHLGEPVGQIVAEETAAGLCAR
jgi:hypothetical protein